MRKSKTKNNHQNLVIELGIYIFSILCFFFISRNLFLINKPFSDNYLMAFYIPIFIFSVIGVGIFLYLDYKYNGLKFKLIFIIFAIAIAVSNIISISSLSSTVYLPFDASINISLSDRIYSIMHGFALCIMPFLALYVIPRKFRHKEYIKLLLVLIVACVCFFFICGLFVDFKNYSITLKSKFEDLTHPCLSLFGHKNVYGRFIFVGIGAVIFLHIYTNNWRWLLFLIPFTVAEFFTFSKMPIFISALLIIVYFVVRMIFVIKRNKNNLLIFSIISVFVLLLASCIISMMCFSQSGLLYSIKNVFIKFGQSAVSTFKSRLVIWECTFKILKPYQYIFGFGYALVGNAIHAVYDTKHIEDTQHIWTAHNSFIEMIAQGGIIYLLINLLILVYLIKVSAKIIKHNRYLGLMNIVIISLLIIQGMTDSVLPFNEGDNLFISALVFIPIMAEYYNHYDKEEINNRYKLLADSKFVLKEKTQNLISKLNQKLYLIAIFYMKKEYKKKNVN